MPGLPLLTVPQVNIHVTVEGISLKSHLILMFRLKGLQSEFPVFSYGVEVCVCVYFDV